jgi:hypothetical protein
MAIRQMGLADLDLNSTTMRNLIGLLLRPQLESSPFSLQARVLRTALLT